MTLSAINGAALSGVSAINGKSKASVDSILGQTLGGGAVDYATPFLAAHGTADAGIIAAIQQLDDDFTAGNLWAKMHVVFPFVGSTAAEFKWNMKDPQNTDAAHRATFHGSGESYTNGYTTGATGLSSYIDTHYIPNGNMTLGSAHTSLCVKSTANDDGNDFGVTSSGTAQILVWIRYSDGNYYDGFLDVSGGTSAANPTSAAGRYIQSRTGTTAYSSYKNNSTLTTSSANVASNALPTHSIYIGGYNQAGTQTDRTFGRQYQFFTAGLGLTPTEVSALDAAIAAFNTALGR